MYLLLIILIIVFAIFFVPIRIQIKYNIQAENEASSKNSVKQDKKDFVLIKLLYFIPVAKINISKKDKNKQDKIKQSGKNNSNIKRQKNINDYIFDVIYSFFMELIGNVKEKKNYINLSEFSKIIKNIYYEKFYLNIGANLDDVIANSYLIASLNMFLCMYINKNIQNFNMSNLYYNSYISKQIYKINFDGILRFKLADNITVILSIILRYIKQKQKQNFKKRKVEIKNGRKTSNRKLNDDRHDIFRKYD